MRASTVTILVVVALLALLRGRRQRIANRADLGLMAVIGVFDVWANLLYGLATTMGILSQVSVLGSVYPVVTVLLAWRLLGERLTQIQYVAAALALGGVALIVS